MNDGTQAETGLRRGELAGPDAGILQLDTDAPTMTVAAGYSKRRQEDTQPIRPALAALLRDYLAGPAARLPGGQGPGGRGSQGGGHQRYDFDHHQ